MPYDAAVIGGGPAGLSAAIWLARYGRRVRVCDSGDPRNEPTWAVHGYPGFPDAPPAELRALMRDQALGAGAEFTSTRVEAVEGEKDRFRIATPEERLEARRVVLAFGLTDVVPEIPGLQEAYGSSVFHCPDCDGPSMAGARVGVLGWDRSAAGLALYLKFWARSVALFANAQQLGLDPAAREVLSRESVEVHEGAIDRLAGERGRISAAELSDGSSIPLDAFFFHIGAVPASGLAASLGCERDDDGYLRVDEGQETSTSGVYAVGDIVGRPHLAISAAASGVRAALTLHRSLLPEEWRL